MSLKISFYITIFLYFIVLFIFYVFTPTNENTNKVEIQKGSSGLISFVFASPAEGLSQSKLTENISTSEGAIADEVSKIQNKISYPAQALEDGLESDCEWSIAINAQQKASLIKTIRPCKYKIFDEEFHRVIQDWNFTLPEHTILHIPVSFKIRKE